MIDVRSLALSSFVIASSISNLVTRIRESLLLISLLFRLKSLKLSFSREETFEERVFTPVGIRSAGFVSGTVSRSFGLGLELCIFPLERARLSGHDKRLSSLGRDLVAKDKHDALRLLNNNGLDLIFLL